MDLIDGGFECRGHERGSGDIDGHAFDDLHEGCGVIPVAEEETRMESSKSRFLPYYVLATASSPL